MRDRKRERETEREKRDRESKGEGQRRKDKTGTLRTTSTTYREQNPSENRSSPSVEACKPPGIRNIAHITQHGLRAAHSPQDRLEMVTRSSPHAPVTCTNNSKCCFCDIPNKRGKLNALISPGPVPRASLNINTTFNRGGKLLCFSEPP